MLFLEPIVIVPVQSARNIPTAPPRQRNRPLGTA